MKRFSLILGLLLVPAIAGAAWTYRGVVWDADWENRRTAWFGSPESARQMDEAIAMGLNTFAITPIARQPNLHAPDIRYAPELEHGLASDMNRIANIGMKVIYQPQIWSDKFQNGNEWAGSIEMKTDADWATWFKNYTAMVVTHARLAEKAGAEVFVVGTEYVRTSSRTVDWQGVIKAVRDVFHGKITYAAHDFREAEAIGFWGDLDFVGLNATFPIAAGGRTDATTLSMSWAQAARRMEALSRQAGRPVLITEVGYASARGTAEQPRVWWPAGTVVDENLQARCYDAMLTTLRRQPWLAGFVIWKYKIGITEPDVSREPSEWYFTFQKKKAEAVIRRHLQEKHP